MSEVRYPCKLCGHAFSEHNAIRGLGECYHDFGDRICNCHGFMNPADSVAVDRLRTAREALEKEHLRIHGFGYGAVDHCGRCGDELNVVWDAVDDLLRGTVTMRPPKPTPVPVVPKRKWYETAIAYLTNTDYERD